MSSLRSIDQTYQTTKWMEMCTNWEKRAKFNTLGWVNILGSIPGYSQWINWIATEIIRVMFLL